MIFVGVLSMVGEIMITLGLSYAQLSGVYSVSAVLKIIPHSTEHPHCTQDNPTFYSR